MSHGIKLSTLPLGNDIRFYLSSTETTHLSPAVQMLPDDVDRVRNWALKLGFDEFGSFCNSLHN
jgi:hypothetical protein